MFSEEVGPTDRDKMEGYLVRGPFILSFVLRVHRSAKRNFVDCVKGLVSMCHLNLRDCHIRLNGGLTNVRFVY